MEKLGAAERLSRGAYLVHYFAGARYFGAKRPLLAGIKLTHRCTLRCAQCPYWRKTMPDLKWAQIRRFLPELYQQGVRIVVFEGGEPLLWRDGARNISDVIDRARRYFFSVGVTTNGTLPIDIKPDIVWVSIDGLKKTHDKLRSNSFDCAIENIKRSRHPKVFAHITINRLNYFEVTNLVRLLEPLVRGITIQFFYPYPESEDLWLPWEKRAAVLDELISLKRQGYPLVNSVSCLEALKANNWSCEPWMVADIDPDGTYIQGCYLKNRTPEKNPCKRCGFSAHAEISLAYQLRLDAIGAGREIFGVF
ncbi:MAG: DUF3463 domain-containing protein [Firmicutes bacterium]|nr:DUF3463 domain-containing protein [Bacillota bacterium]